MIVYSVNAFVKNMSGGNPAGVVWLDEALEEKTMLKVAQIMGYSETAFVQKLDEKTFRLRFFTPAAEVDLCGHATIASFTLLRELGRIAIGTYTQETKAGRLAVKVQEKDVFMEMAPPTFHEQADPLKVALSLGIQEADLLPGYPVQGVSTGLKDIIVPLASLKTLESLTPDFEAISKISDAYGAVGYHVFTFDTSNEETIRVRNFAPLYDIDEEAATGTANGALMAYLNLYDPKPRSLVTFEQGYEMNLPSEICVRREEDGRIFVGGQAELKSQKEVTI